ncbi:TPA: hypothetical protein EYP44_04625 [Candidatus Bathyarchaeota archaeon]|nr:hypothetical protein [Candidatus Bathyarchaeota archaeon]
MQLFIEYKVMLRGLRVRYVDPKNTSKSCFGCGEK